MTHATEPAFDATAAPDALDGTGVSGASVASELTHEDRLELEAAHLLLENPGLAAKMAGILGTSIEAGIKSLPEGAQDKILKAANAALSTALNAALLAVDDSPGKPQKNRLYKSGVAVSGAVGGAFGLPALLMELPVATTIMLRSIADIARRHGESISDPNTKTACLEVFAMGGRGASDDSTESGYMAVRIFLAEQVSEASRSLAKTAAEKSAPAIARLISAIAPRFGFQVSQKAAAQLVPVAGAIGGATVNLLFMQHFQDMAQGHFAMRRLERKYGNDLVWQEYKRLNKAARPPNDSQ